MPAWYAKALVQKVISAFPQRERINHWFQANVTGGVHLTDRHFADKLQHSLDHIRFFRRFGEPHPEARILELGSGWYPIVPLCFYLSGSGRVDSVDIQSWMNAERQAIAIRKLLEWRKGGRSAELEALTIPERWQSLEALAERCDTDAQLDAFAIGEAIGLRTHLVDARSLAFDDASFDFTCSNNTFEHIPRETLEGILSEFKRVSKRASVWSHFVDLSDHFAHSDPSISIYHFLRFSKKQWAWIDNRIQPQNRMRWPEYLSMYQALDIPVTHTETRPGDLEALSREALHPDYRRFSPEEAAISHGYLVSVC
jgi:hypothetical protein